MFIILHHYALKYVIHKKYILIYKKLHYTNHSITTDNNILTVLPLMFIILCNENI